MNIRNLQVGDTVVAKNAYSDRGTEYVVVKNDLDDVLFLWNESKGKGYHIFYDSEEDLKFQEVYDLIQLKVVWLLQFFLA